MHPFLSFFGYLLIYADFGFLNFLKFVWRVVVYYYHTSIFWYFINFFKVLIFFFVELHNNSDQFRFNYEKANF